MNAEYIYKTDLHCHTSEASGCASENGADTVEKYIRCGYSSVAITNHFSPGHFEGFGGSYEKFVERYYNAIDVARRAAGDRFNVLTGMELKTQDSFNDYLVFGTTKEMMLEFSNVFSLYIDKVHEFFSSRGCIVIQAHPMRYGITLIEPEFVDGYEILNTHPEWESHNEIAAMWAKQVGGENAIITAGTDHHDTNNIPTSGILTKEPIRSDEELLKVLRSGDYKIFGGSAGEL